MTSTEKKQALVDLLFDMENEEIREAFELIENEQAIEDLHHMLHQQLFG